MKCRTCDRLPKCGRLVDDQLVYDVPLVPGMEVWIPGYGNGKRYVQAVTQNGIEYAVQRWAGWRLEKISGGKCYDTEAACKVAEES